MVFFPIGFVQALNIARMRFAFGATSQEVQEALIGLGMSTQGAFFIACAVKVDAQ